jgi:hypothetical protein
MFHRTYVFILMISSRILENKTLIFQIQLWPPWTHCEMEIFLNPNFTTKF